jgi:predicted nucleic acid-binding protein
LEKCHRGELGGEEAGLAAELLANSGIAYVSMGGLLAAATELAIRLRHPAYDCIYLAAAIEARVPFVTADSRLIQKLQQQRFGDAACYDLSAATLV